VEQTYYRLLNASGQEVAARASLTNAETVEQSAEERLKQGLATLPDVLEARSATALARYELQAVLGAEDIARGDLAAALGDLPNVVIQPQPLDRLSIPNSVEDTVDRAIQRAFAERPDLLDAPGAGCAVQPRAPAFCFERLPRSESLLPCVQPHGLARHQHGSHHMLFDRVDDNWCIPSKTDAAADRGLCRGSAGSGVAAIRSALYRFDRRIYRLVYRGDERCRVVRNVYAASFLFRTPGCVCVQFREPPGIHNPDLADACTGPCRRHTALAFP